MTYQGDDARQGDRLRTYAEWAPDHELEPGYYTPATDAHKRWRIAQVDKVADIIYSVNPDLCRVLPARTRFLPYSNVDPREWRVSPLKKETAQPPLVLHAPTHRGVKGTRYIVDAVRRLQADGIEFRFEMLENLPRARRGLDTWKRTCWWTNFSLAGMAGWRSSSWPLANRCSAIFARPT